jgi:hypothetical protein
MFDIDELWYTVSYLPRYPNDVSGADVIRIARRYRDIYYHNAPELVKEACQVMWTT